MIARIRAVLALFNTKATSLSGVALATTSFGSLVRLATDPSGIWLAAMLHWVRHHDADPHAAYQGLAAGIGIAIGLAGAYFGMPANVSERGASLPVDPPAETETKT